MLLLLMMMSLVSVTVAQTPVPSRPLGERYFTALSVGLALFSRRPDLPV